MPIREFLSGKSILITGATGFLGKPLVEKILRDVPEVRQIFLLVRPKRRGSGAAMSAEKRIEQDLLGSEVFSRLRAERADFGEYVRGKLRAVPGDVSTDGLDMAPEDAERLAEEVDVIINSAAVVVFDERIDYAVQLNTLGPKRLIEFAKQCVRRPVFIHVSTAYVNGQRVGLAFEKPFQPNQSIAQELSAEAPPFTIEQEIEYGLACGRQVEEEARQPRLLEQFHRAAMRELGPGHLPGSNQVKAQAEMERSKYIRTRLVRLGMGRARIHGWHDTYTFTKAMGEQLLVRDHEDIPVAIIRPAIIESSFREPEPGWIDGFRMADPLIAAYGKGRLRDFPGDRDCALDIIPVDFVVNAILAAIPHMAQQKGLELFQVATGSMNPISLGEFSELTWEYFTSNPMKNRKGEPIRIEHLRYYHPRQRFERRFWLRERMPMAVAEWVTRRLPGLKKYRNRAAVTRNAIERISYYTYLYGPYVEYACRFGTENTARLVNELAEEERAAFDFDVRRIDWRQYICDIHVPGLKRHVLKMDIVDEEDVADRGRARKADVDPEKALDTGIQTIQDIVLRSAARFGNKTALQIKRNGKWVRFSFRQVRDLSDQYRTSLARAGLRKGDRVLLIGENQPEWGIAYLGAMSLGITVVPLDRQTRGDEVLRIADFVQTRHILTSPASRQALAAQVGDRVQGLRVLNVNNYALDADAPDQAQPPYSPEEFVPREEVTPDEVASIIFTSGTTVDPKGVMLTHRNFVSDVVATFQVLAPFETDQFLSVLPLHHAFEFTGGFLMPLFCGPSVTYVTVLNSKAVIETMQETGTTALLGVPRLFKLFHDGIRTEVEKAGVLASGVVEALKTVSQASQSVAGLNSGRRLFAKVHERFGGRVRAFVSGGAALDPFLFDEFHRMGFPILEGYGLTETSPILTVNPLERPKRGSVGIPLPGIELRIDNPNAEGVGEIVVRGPVVMKGYLKNEEATGKVLKDGWFHTGDLGRFDDEGYLYITGRVKDLVVTAAGKNVYPDEVELIYRDLPGVKEICVLGVRSEETLGEEVHLVVVMDSAADKVRAQEDVKRQIKRISRDIPTYQRAQHLHFWDEELPKTPTLKVKRNLVRQSLIERQRAQETAARARPAPTAAATASWEAGFMNLLSQVTGVPAQQIRPENDLQYDLSMDSLMKVEFLVAADNTYGVSLPESLASRLHLVQDAMDVVRAELVKQEGKAEPESAEHRGAFVDWAHILRAGDVAGIQHLRIDRRGRLDGLAGRLFQKGLGCFCRHYLSLERRGTENLPASGPYIIAANHCSHLDSPVILSVLESQAQRIRILGARDYFFDRRIKGWFFSTFLNVLPFDRKERFLEGLRIAHACIQKDYVLLIFPEGTRSLDGETQNFKVGLGIIAYELDVPIVPAWIEGTYEALPKGRSLPRRWPVSVTFGPPVLMSHFTPPATGTSRFPLYKEIVDVVRERVIALGGQPVDRLTDEV